MAVKEYTLGRRFMGRLPHGEDLITAIIELCRGNRIQTAAFSLIGAVSHVTMGSYDQKQQVYVTFEKQAPFEIVTCSGNVSLKDGAPFVHVHAVLGDEKGGTIGGHVFSKTIVFAAEITIQELVGEPLERVYDPVTGLMLWENACAAVQHLSSEPK